MKVIGYCRVSTDVQANEGVSLDAQRARIHDWARLHDGEVIGIEIDAGISGGRADNRQGLQAALDSACRERAVLVVYSLSRLARSTRDALNISERLARAGAEFVSLSENLDTTSAAGKMIFRIMAVLAEFERDQISERVKTALLHMRKTNRLYGEVPYGYDCADGKTLTLNASEQAALRLIMSLRTKRFTLDRICAALELHGYRTKQRCRHWRSNTVHRILIRCARDYGYVNPVLSRSKRTRFKC